MSVNLSIIIVNWNGRKLLEDCFANISKFPPSCEYELIVVDNSSSDDSVEWLNQKKLELGEQLHLILNDENVGFGRANNQAMRLSKARYFLLLNSDAYVQADSIDPLLAELDRNSSVGVAAPRLLNVDMTLQPSVFRNPPTAWEILIVGLRIYKLLPGKFRGNLLLGPFWSHNERKEVRFVSGAALVVRREVFLDVGGFDESFHMYGEDCEYNLRISRAGWKIVLCPDAEVVHLGAESTVSRWGQAARNDKYLSGFLQFQRTSLTWFQVRSNCVAAVVVILLEKIWRRLLNRPTDDIDSSLVLYLDFLRNT